MELDLKNLGLRSTTIYYTHTQTHTHKLTYTHACAHTHTRAHTHTHTHTHLTLTSHTRTSHRHTHIHTHIHTHTHTPTRWWRGSEKAIKQVAALLIVMSDTEILMAGGVEVRSGLKIAGEHLLRAPHAPRLPLGHVIGNRRTELASGVWNVAVFMYVSSGYPSGSRTARYVGYLFGSVYLLN